MAKFRMPAFLIGVLAVLTLIAASGVQAVRPGFQSEPVDSIPPEPAKFF